MTKLKIRSKRERDVALKTYHAMILLRNEMGDCKYLNERIEEFHALLYNPHGISGKTGRVLSR